jgi:hypothetical protein
MLVYKKTWKSREKSQIRGTQIATIVAPVIGYVKNAVKYTKKSILKECLHGLYAINELY